MDAWKTVESFPFLFGMANCQFSMQGVCAIITIVGATPRHEEIVKSSQELTVGPAMPVTSTSRSTSPERSWKVFETRKTEE